MAFTLNIETDNAAFTDQPAAEIARILQDVAHYLIAGSVINLFDGDSMKLRDINGNTVGRWEYSSNQEGGGQRKKNESQARHDQFHKNPRDYSKTGCGICREQVLRSLLGLTVDDGSGATA